MNWLQAIKEENKKIYGHKWKWKHDSLNPLGCSKRSPRGKIYYSPCLSEETRKIPNIKPNWTPKGPRSSTAKKPQTSRRWEIRKIRGEINNIESKKKKTKTKTKNRKKYNRSMILRTGFWKNK